MIDLRQLLPASLREQAVSVLDAELHPRYRDNQQLFLTYVHPGDGGHTRLSRLTLTTTSPPTAMAGSEEVIITWPSGGHNAGCLEFGTDGYLYIATGDGSGPNPPDGLTTGQDVTDLLGAILRIDVDRRGHDAAYSIPDDNPFVEHANAGPRFGRTDSAIRGNSVSIAGRQNLRRGQWLGNMGDDSSLVRGGNCGWPMMEGRRLRRK